ncbi:MAG: ABC transporter permease [Spirochaetales bacterium]|nr:ABC transporter permease [Spirochaetales bacterium]MCF7937001.1 ABC transporter permease [Spirochaetales bacterium]
MKLTIKNMQNFVLFVILLAVVAVISISLPDKFLTAINFQSMTSQFPEFGLMALAMMMAMITGGIDLSVVSVANLSGVMAALVLTSQLGADGGISATMLIVLAIIVALVTSVVAGAINGLIITLAGVPAILATLGTQGLFLGIAIVITEGHSISGFPPEYLFVGMGQILGLPMPLVIFLITIALLLVIMKKTRQGFNMYVVGANPIVSRFSGVNNTRALIQTYMLTGLMAGIASIIIISRVNSMRPGYGSAYLLQAVLVTVMGGTDPRGGFGNVFGVVMAVVILQVIQSGLNIMSFSPFFKNFTWGFMLLLIMVINFYLNRYQQGRRIAETKKRVAAEASGNSP